jgi:hypothetical protein
VGCIFHLQTEKLSAGVVLSILLLSDWLSSFSKQVPPLVEFHVRRGRSCKNSMKIIENMLPI